MPLLDGQIVPASAIDPAKHKFLGVFRPPQIPDTKYIDEKTGVVQYAGILVCPCGQHLHHMGAIAVHYRQGCFDVPQYVSINDRSDASINIGWFDCPVCGQRGFASTKANCCTACANKGCFDVPQYISLYTAKYA